jgi:beta-galactosidase/beta-glucuronidase
MSDRPTDPTLLHSPDSVPRAEYPRPQFVRSAWLNLNGPWEFAFDDQDEGIRGAWKLGLPFPRSILVPFPYQSSLSGIGDKAVHEIIWYARRFEIPREWAGQNLLLHFGAVDYECTVWLNGRELGHNRGGHTPFNFNIAPYIEPGSSNLLTLRVADFQNPSQPRGKQSITGLPHDIDYYCTSGIWQTVWVEPVSAVRIDSIRMRSAESGGALDLTVMLHAPCHRWRLTAEIIEGETVVAQAESLRSAASLRLLVPISNAKFWSPDSPHLYDLRLRLFDQDILLDEVDSYFGLRNLEVRDGSFWLNGEALYLRMVLDQGYWPESYLAAPSDAALRSDVQWVKDFGFNGVRKHQKIEDPRWLYWCDRLGLLVWGEMPNARDWSAEAEERLASEWRRTLERDYNHPSIVAWVPVNESMGFPELRNNHVAQHSFIEHMVSITRKIDPDRAVIDNDGWEHSDITDVCAIHDYTPTASLLKERYKEALLGGALPAHVWIGNKPLFLLGSRYRGQPIVLSEVGGFLQIPSNLPQERLDMLFNHYGSCSDAEELLHKYGDLMEGISGLTFVAGFCYTQLTDIEQETNGLLGYDRKPKVDPELIARIHSRFFGSQTKAL